MTDMVIALGLVGIVIVMFLISKMGLLPKKSLPFVAAGLAAVFGLTILRERRARSLKNDLDKQEAEIKKREDKLEILKTNADVAEQDYYQGKAAYESQRAAHKKEILMLDTKEIKERERRAGLSGAELDDEYEQFLMSIK